MLIQNLSQEAQEPTIAFVKTEVSSRSLQKELHFLVKKSQLLPPNFTTQGANGFH